MDEITNEITNLLTGLKNADEKPKPKICDHGEIKPEWSELLNTWIFPVCPKCYADREKKYQAEIKRRMIEAERVTAFRESGIGKRYDDCKLSEYIAETPSEMAARSTIIDFTQGVISDTRAGKQWLFFSGPPGVGKTMLFAIAFRGLIDKGKKPRYFEGAALLNEIKSKAYATGSRETVSSAVKKLLDADALFIDDLGIRLETKATAHDLEILYEIFNQAYKDFKPIAISTNLKTEKLLKILDAGAFGRISDRVAHMTRNMIVEFPSNHKSRRD